MPQEHLASVPNSQLYKLISIIVFDFILGLWGRVTLCSPGCLHAYSLPHGLRCEMTITYGRDLWILRSCFWTLVTTWPNLSLTLAVFLFSLFPGIVFCELASLCKEGFKYLDIVLWNYTSYLVCTTVWEYFSSGVLFLRTPYSGHFLTRLSNLSARYMRNGYNSLY